ncbi:uncharacterized protein NECHADRAFT_67271 [Fusarium vanettenii 77-13-4]|uniref:Annexin ANXC4 n=1 Tax=Fusarium vanettenii (strain ATCC MYA-4622 / CBS 123669 / FGSC 9596 / NRRL 45880 / 77-13-4) TaxID=660122 RepID=C7YLX9_FUSV7|nr:uncharacterized protein NECHADRAFT_67271 [Fusarium vanettenii 77-13-4]EEU47354.1 hypothetical protein NECHADRAFT_67271 [Fusarium vanettenii 77-13-4]
MSLNVDDRSRKGRSRSRSRDRRSKDEVPSERPGYGDRESSYIYPEDDLDDRYNRPGDPKASGALPYPEEGGLYSMVPGEQGDYSQQPTYRTASPPHDSPYRASHERVDNNPPGAFPEDNRREKEKEPYTRTFKFLPQKYSRKIAAKITGQSSDSDKEKDKKDNRSRKDKYDDDLAYGKPSTPARPKGPSDDLAYGKATGIPSTASQAQHSGAPPPKDQYYPPQQPTYAHGEHEYDPDRRRPHSPAVDEYGPRRSREDAYRTEYSTNVLTVEPKDRDRDRSRDRRKEKDGRSSSDRLGVDSSSRKREKSRDRSRRREKSPHHHRHRSRSKDGHRSRKDKSPAPPTEKMSSLSVNTALAGGLAAGGLAAGASLANAPPSPMLESYYGTYQACSPMPSPLMLPTADDKALVPLSPLDSDNEGDSRRRNRRARFHDAEDITTQLAQALKSSHRPDTAPLIEILPSLTHEQVMELRAEYKRLVKTGPERKGVNLAKHIRARLKDEDSLLMKACYSVALGRWESEAYWANFWYQGDKTRRELLIESLMGRTNGEIRLIKDAFTDKKYDNSLIKCMKEELKEDKFKKAVLMVLDERRMEEYDHYGRLQPIDYGLVDQDVADLRRAIRSEKGGETAMITIIVQRSDSHLRAILQEYERQFRANFARDALKKSGNLVGELLAHILNGVINRPVRDALLLHHAISASRKDGLRRELLISRLVRYHWDPDHMRAVKQAYRERYNRGLGDAVREATSGEWGMFCEELCIARTPPDVRRFDKISYSTR